MDLILCMAGLTIWMIWELLVSGISALIKKDVHFPAYSALFLTIILGIVYLDQLNIIIGP